MGKTVTKRFTVKIEIFDRQGRANWRPVGEFNTESRVEATIKFFPDIVVRVDDNLYTDDSYFAIFHSATKTIDRDDTGPWFFQPFVTVILHFPNVPPVEVVERFDDLGPAVKFAKQYPNITASFYEHNNSESDEHRPYSLEWRDNQPIIIDPDGKDSMFVEEDGELTVDEKKMDEILSHREAWTGGEF